MNKTITVYELLGLVKDGKAPKRIKFKEEYFDLRNGRYYNSNYTDEISEESLGAYFCLDGLLNDTVEIIEDNDKLEKIKSLNNVGGSSDLGEFEDKQHLNNHILKDKINKIINHINKIEEKLDEK
jgi:hypothetical protein